jgi:hypothetical protein
MGSNEDILTKVKELETLLGVFGSANIFIQKDSAGVTYGWQVMQSSGSSIGFNVREVN